MFDQWRPKPVSTGAGRTGGMKWGEAKAWLKSGGFAVGNSKGT